MKLWLTRTFLVVGLVLLATPAFAQKVNTDFDKSADFSKYRTYAWIETKNPAKSDLNHRRIIELVEQQLAAKGFQKATGGTPDVYVVYNAGLKERVSVQGYDYGYGGMGWGRYGGGGMVRYDQYIDLEGTLIVDLVDANRKEMVWRGTAVDTLSDKPDKNVKKAQKALEKMFKKYPPQRK